MAKQGGDDLDDDFVPDDLVAMSDEEEAIHPPEADDISGLLSADEDERGAKVVQNEGTVVGNKKRKRRAKEKERRAKKLKLAQSTQLPEPSLVAARSPMLLADYLSSMQAKTFSKMSAIELADIRIPETCIVDTTQWTGSRDLDQLVDFITTILPTLHTRLSQRSKANGSPTLIYVTGAALRVADLTRVLKDKKLRSEKGGEVAKLFARHFKLEEHVAYLKRTKIAAAVGTPGRLGKLLCDTDALSTSALTHIILDVSFLDAKKRSLLDIPETRDEVFKTILGAPDVSQGLAQGKIQLVLL